MTGVVWPRYEKSFGEYWFVENESGSMRVHIGPEVAIGYDAEDGTLLKHGEPAKVNSWFLDRRAKMEATGDPLLRKMAANLRVVSSRHWDPEALTRIVSHSGTAHRVIKEAMAALAPVRPETVVIGIIGTAGRDQPKRARMTYDLYAEMYRDAKARIAEIAKGRPVRLVSGGAAWGDHLAVNLFLKKAAGVAELQLHLPAELYPDSDSPLRGFVTTGDRNDPGRTANYYHKLFTEALSEPAGTRPYHDTITDLYDALAREGSEAVVYPGFHARNRAVADAAEWLLAYTWGPGKVPADGGTKHTWDQSAIPAARKIHVPLASLEPGYVEPEPERRPPPVSEPWVF